MNGNGFTNGFPNWIKIIAQVGFPIFISTLLIAWLIPAMVDIQAKVNQHIQTVVRPINQIDEQTKLLRIICYNTAPNEFQRASCDKQK